MREVPPPACGKKGGRGRLIGLTKGGMNTKLHAVTHTSEEPIHLSITAGQVSDYAVEAALMNGLPEADWLLADRGRVQVGSVKPL